MKTFSEFMAESTEPTLISKLSPRLQKKVNALMKKMKKKIDNGTAAVHLLLAKDDNGEYNGDIEVYEKKRDNFVSMSKYKMEYIPFDDYQENAVKYVESNFKPINGNYEIPLSYNEDLVVYNPKASKRDWVGIKNLYTSK